MNESNYKKYMYINGQWEAVSDEDDQSHYSKQQVDNKFDNLGDVEFNHPEEGIVDVEKDGNSWYLTSSSSQWYGEVNFTKGIPAIEENLEIEIDFDSVDTTESYVLLLAGNDLNDLSTSVFYSQISSYYYDLQQDKIILDLSNYRNIIGSYDYIFLSLSSGPYSLGFNNPIIKYKDYGTVVVKKTINDDYSTTEEIQENYTTKEEVNKKIYWEDIACINKGASGTSELLSYSDLQLPANHGYKKLLISFYINGSGSGATYIDFNDSSAAYGTLYFGTVVSSGLKFYQILIEDITIKNVGGLNKNFNLKTTIDKCNSYQYGSRSNYLAFTDQNITLADIRKIKINIGTNWTADGAATNGCYVVVQGRK